MTKKITAKAAIKNVFGNAEVKTTEKPKKSTNKRAEVEMDSGFELLIALTLVDKAIEGVKKQLEAQYKDHAYEIFSGEISDTGKKPDSFIATHGVAQAMFQFKKRSAGFSEEIAHQLERSDISFEREASTEERYIINPDLLDDQYKLGKLAKAIEELNLDFPVIQKQEAKYKYNINDTTLSEVSKLSDENLKAELIKAISTIAISHAKISSNSEINTLDIAMQILKNNKIF